MILGEDCPAVSLLKLEYLVSVNIVLLGYFSAYLLLVMELVLGLIVIEFLSLIIVSSLFILLGEF